MSIEITDWLRGLGLEQYAPAFRDNDIDGELLRRLTAEDLRELGVASVGHRRRLLDAIAALGAPAPAANVSGPPAETTLTLAPKAAAERRQLTVMFCDLVGSTPLSARLDPVWAAPIRNALRHSVLWHLGFWEWTGAAAVFLLLCAAVFLMPEEIKP